MHYKTVVLAVALVLSAVAHAQESEKVLLPVAIRGQILGAQGSLWETRLSLLNHGEHTLAIDGIETDCRIPPCFAAQLAPHMTVNAQPAVTANTTTRGYFLFVDRTRTDDLSAQLRVQDVSRQSQTWGTVVPAVKEREAILTAAELLDIPLGSAFRSLVRIYDFDPAAAHAVRVRIFGVSETPGAQIPDVLLWEESLVLRATADPRYPGYAELPLANLSLPESGRVRIEVRPETTGLRFWAFASVTNNETQHVTTILPLE